MITDNTTDAGYVRIIPRDLFNEAKLLKCMGRLILFAHDGMVPGADVEFEENGEPFAISRMLDGTLTITNLPIKIKDKRYVFKTTCNSRNNYPLYVEHNNVDYLIFDEHGDFCDEWDEFLKQSKTKTT